MADFTRLVPMMVAAGLAATNLDEVEELWETTRDLTFVAVAKMELAGISTVVHTQAAGDNLPSDAQYDFGAWLGEHLHMPAGGDVSVDPWGVPYRLKITYDAYEIASSGPDMSFETIDDLVHKVPRK